MRTVFLIVLLAITSAASAASQAVMTQATENLVNAVVTKPGGEDTGPRRPEVTDQVKLGIAKELWDDPSIQASYAQLAATKNDYAWFRGLEKLEETKAAWCLASTLCHPSGEVRIRAARALARLKNEAVTPFALDVADAFAVMVDDPAAATLNGRFQHVLADLINGLTGEKATLKDGQDPAALRAALPAWKRAFRNRSGPLDRSAKDRAAIEAIKSNIQTFSLTAVLAPKAQGQWDPAFEVTSVTLSVAPPANDASENANGKSTAARAQLTPDEAELIVEWLADLGFFSHATPTIEPRTDRHGQVEITAGSGGNATHYAMSFNWDAAMLKIFDRIRAATDGPAAQAMRKLLAPLADQRREWAQVK